MKLRDYQQDAVDALFDYWKTPDAGNCVLELATGLGKSLISAEIDRRLGMDFPQVNILNLTHVKELIEQNYKTLNKVWPFPPAGIYSAGLKRRETAHRILFAGIQSVANKVDLIGTRHVIKIDECHLVSLKVATRYQQLLQALMLKFPNLKVVGLTATPYRLDSGSIVGDSENHIFKDQIFSYNIADGINDGWLTPVISRGSEVHIDTSNVSVRGGEFVEGEMQNEAMKIIGAAVQDIMARAYRRNCILVFCSGVKHAHEVAAAFREAGWSAGTVTGEMGDEERDEILDDFRSGRVRVLTNANILTTGFDNPRVDCIAMVRSTLSKAMYVQIIGRGTRLSEEIAGPVNFLSSAEERRAMIAQSEKPDCLFLDYGENMRRHGPVNLIQVSSYIEPKAKRDDVDDNAKTCGQCGIGSPVTDWDVLVRECPECHHIKCRSCGNYRPAVAWQGEEKNICPVCEHNNFGPLPEKLQANHNQQADEEFDIIDEPEPEKIWRQIVHWGCKHHQNKSDEKKPPTLHVQYLDSDNKWVSEWVCFEHPRRSIPRRKAERFWRDHGGEGPCPNTVNEVVKAFPSLTPPSAILTEKEDRFHRVLRREFGAAETSLSQLQEELF